ncbi:hypothetical protein K1W54_06950 [Micromonospora sp. CPCC 205371]|nr:hypothetical protein [Micromonospora sp. CPCC 205371]
MGAALVRGGYIDGKPPQQDVFDVGGHWQVGRGMRAAVAHDGSPFAAVDTIWGGHHPTGAHGSTGTSKEDVPVDLPGR